MNPKGRIQGGTNHLHGKTRGNPTPPAQSADTTQAGDTELTEVMPRKGSHPVSPRHTTGAAETTATEKERTPAGRVAEPKKGRAEAPAPTAAKAKAPVPRRAPAPIPRPAPFPSKSDERGTPAAASTAAAPKPAPRPATTARATPPHLDNSGVDRARPAERPKGSPGGPVDVRKTLLDPTPPPRNSTLPEPTDSLTLILAHRRAPLAAPQAKTRHAPSPKSAPTQTAPTRVADPNVLARLAGPTPDAVTTRPSEAPAPVVAIPSVPVCPKTSLSPQASPPPRPRADSAAAVGPSVQARLQAVVPTAPSPSTAPTLQSQEEPLSVLPTQVFRPKMSTGTHRTPLLQRMYAPKVFDGRGNVVIASKAKVILGHESSRATPPPIETEPPAFASTRSIPRDLQAPSLTRWVLVLGAAVGALALALRWTPAPPSAAEPMAAAPALEGRLVPSNGPAPSPIAPPRPPIEPRVALAPPSPDLRAPNPTDEAAHPVAIVLTEPPDDLPTTAAPTALTNRSKTSHGSGAPSKSHGHGDSSHKKGHAGVDRDKTPSHKTSSPSTTAPAKPRSPKKDSPKKSRGSSTAQETSVEQPLDVPLLEADELAREQLENSLH